MRRKRNTMAKVVGILGIDCNYNAIRGPAAVH